jgi:hypothetical protein
MIQSGTSECQAFSSKMNRRSGRSTPCTVLGRAAS